MNIKFCHWKKCAGFTLTELLIASFIASMMLLTLLTAYIMGVRFLKTGITLAMEQQRMTVAMEQIAEIVRPAYKVGIGRINAFPLTSYPSSASFATMFSNNVGNCLMLMGNVRLTPSNTYVLTSMVCQISNMVYYSPNAANLGAISTCYVLASSVLPRTNMFTVITNSILVRLAFVDTIIKTQVVIETETFLSPRNVRSTLAITNQ